MKSEKLSLKKTLGIAWIIMAILFAGLAITTCVKYANYRSAQKLAVAVTMEATDTFRYRTDDFENNYNELVEDMYYFFHPLWGSMYDADQALGKVMNAAGYDDASLGSSYFEFTNIFSFASSYFMGQTRLFAFIWDILAVILVLITVWYNCVKKTSMEITDTHIICRKGKKTVKEFLLKDVKSVSLCGIQGLTVLGNGIKYHISLIHNRDALKTQIMNYLAVHTKDEAAPVLSTDADELKKYKDLLDAGAITQEEFDSKKKQILGL